MKENKYEKEKKLFFTWEIATKNKFTNFQLLSIEHEMFVI